MRLSHLVRSVIALWAVTVFPSFAVSAVESVSVKAPEISIPPGTKPGVLRRIIQPFDQWTLICDENLKTRTRVCNVSQTLVDPRGKIIFSWSLAAGDNGAPLFVVRLPAELAGDHFVQIIFGGKTPTRSGVILSNCSPAICLGYLEVDAKIKHQIGAEAPIQIKVRLGAHVETFATTLAGLGPAVASLK